MDSVIMNQTHFPIHPMILRIDTVQNFNVFNKIDDDKFDLFHGQGKPYISSTHKKIFNDSISALYVKLDDVRNYLDYLENFLIIIINDPIINTQTKARIIHQLLTSNAKNLLKDPKPETTSRYRRVIKVFSDYIIKHDDAMQLIIAETISNSNDYTHLVNVGIYGMGFAMEVLPRDGSHNLGEIAAGLFLHDIGMCQIPVEISQKNDSLTEKEWETIRKHPEYGCDMLRSFRLLRKETEIIVSQHHERHNGKGYPRKLRGKKIHFYSRLCAIADTFDALTSDRPYRPAHSSFDALKIMHKEMKDEFDPRIFKKFVMLFFNKNLELKR